MLRLACPGWRTLEDLRQSGMVEALGRETTFRRRASCRRGPVSVCCRWAGLTSPRCGTRPDELGASRLLGHYLTERNLEKMASCLPELTITGGVDPSRRITTRRFEHWLSRDEEKPHRRGRTGPLPARDLLERMHRHVEAAYAAIDRSALRVIHCRPMARQYQAAPGVLHPLDFEDTVRGFRAHDIAMAMPIC